MQDVPIISIGILIIAVSVPLVLRKVPPQKWYGIRFPASYKSEENWYKINHDGGWICICWGAILIVYGALPRLFHWNLSGSSAHLYLLGFILLLIIPVVILGLYAARFK